MSSLSRDGAHNPQPARDPKRNMTTEMCVSPFCDSTDHDEIRNWERTRQQPQTMNSASRRVCLCTVSNAHGVGTFICTVCSARKLELAKRPVWLRRSHRSPHQETAGTQRCQGKTRKTTTQYAITCALNPPMHRTQFGPQASLEF